MATQKTPVLTRTRPATGAISAYLAVTALGAVAAAGSEAFGWATSDAAIGEDFAVDLLGTTTALAGEAIAAGADVEVGADGKMVVHDAGAKCGVAMFAAGADQPFEMLIDKHPAPPES